MSSCTAATMRLEAVTLEPATPLFVPDCCVWHAESKMTVAIRDNSGARHTRMEPIIEMTSQSPLILASSSPRRRQILEALGLSFEVQVTEIDETPAPGEPPEALALRLATAKAEVAALRFPGSSTIGSDTVVALGTESLGKPSSPADAGAM